jgi:hypothetical protein
MRAGGLRPCRRHLSTGRGPVLGLVTRERKRRQLLREGGSYGCCADPSFARYADDEQIHSRATAPAVMAANWRRCCEGADRCPGALSA